MTCLASAANRSFPTDICREHRGRRRGGGRREPTPTHNTKGTREKDNTRGMNRKSGLWRSGNGPVVPIGGMPLGGVWLCSRGGCVPVAGGIAHRSPIPGQLLSMPGGQFRKKMNKEISKKTSSCKCIVL